MFTGIGVARAMYGFPRAAWLPLVALGLIAIVLLGQRSYYLRYGVLALAAGSIAGLWLAYRGVPLFGSLAAAYVVPAVLLVAAWITAKRFEGRRDRQPTDITGQI
jgi:membrane protein implicated in regulation of membrane protease activity